MLVRVSAVEVGTPVTSACPLIIVRLAPLLTGTLDALRHTMNSIADAYISSLGFLPTIGYTHMRDSHAFAAGDGSQSTPSCAV